jgi:WD40 repeat protein
MEMSEIKQLVLAKTSGKVAIANYFPAKNILMAVYLGDGYIRAWDIGDAIVSFERNLGIVSDISSAFDESGNLVMGALLHEFKKNDFDDLVEYVGGVAIWDIDTGKLVYCVVHPCDKSAIEWQREAIVGATLDPNGRWVFENREIWISLSDITGVEPSYSFSEGGDEKPRYATLIAINSYNNRYAIADREGEVIINEIGRTGLGWILSRFFLGTYDEKARHETKALNFSPDGKLLARIQDDRLTVWRITDQGGVSYIEHNIPKGGLLAFDRSSSMLFIGTNEAILIWDLKNKMFLGEYATPGITSLAISMDNRVLIWGDISGGVHVWGIQ